MACLNALTRIRRHISILILDAERGVIWGPLKPGGHWSFNDDTYFGKDDVTGKRGDVSDAVYVIVG